MLVPAALRNNTVLEAGANYLETIDLVEAQDYDFNDAEDLDGDKLYQFDTIDGDVYEDSFQSGWGGSVGTLSWRASVYVRKDAFEDNEAALNAFVEATARARQQLIADFE